MRERRRTHIDAQHRAEPRVLAHALVHHLFVLFVHTVSAPIGLVASQRVILVPELTPDAHDLYALGFVTLNEKIVSHGSYLDASVEFPNA
jgi:hypothetical protein